MIDVFLYSFLSIIPISICFGIFGSFGIWEKNVFFSHSFAHSLMLPISISVLFNQFKINFLIIIFCIIFVSLFEVLQKSQKIKQQNDSILTIVSFFCLSIGLLIGNISQKNKNIMMYIVGDIFFIEKNDLILFSIISIVSIIYTLKFGKILILNSISEELCISLQKNTKLIHFIFILIQSIFLAFAARSIGILLISATFMMPSLFTSMFTKSPKQTIIISILFATFSMMLSYTLSIYLNIQFTCILVIVYSIFILFGYIIKYGISNLN